MRRLAAISLLLVFVALSSSAMPIACATNCARMAQPASAMPGMDMPMEHPHAMPASPGFAATPCAGHAPRLLAQRIVTPPSHSAAPQLVPAQTIAVATTTRVARVLFTASPPGPPLLPTQLRI